MNNVWKNFTKINLKLNKKRTIVTIIGVILSVALLSAVSSMFMSTRQSLILYETSYKGNFHYGFLNVTAKDIKELKLNRKIESLTVSETVGYAKIDGITNKDKPYVYIKATDKENVSNMGIRLVEGRLPENDSEILVAEHLETNGEVKLEIGQKINLNVGQRKDINGNILLQDTPLEADEVLENIFSKEYTVVGIMKRQSSSLEAYSAPGYTVITCSSDNNYSENKKYDVYARYNKKGLKEYLKTTANILNVDEEKFAKIFAIGEKVNVDDETEMKELTDEMQKSKYQFISNDYLIMVEKGIAKDQTMKMLGVVVVVLFIIIIITSVFCIRNSFEISITEKIKQYGMLASIGATKKQIRRNVYYESLILAVIGIPIGVVIGNVAAFILMRTANLLLSEFLTFNLIFKFSWLAAILSAILGLITVLLSARKSARKASKISPIVAIRNSENIKIKAKKLRVPWIIKKIFGIGGEISYKNLKRSRKKYRTTVISIAVCVVTFITIYSFMDIANKVLKLEIQTTNYNFAFSYPDVSEEEKKNIDERVRNWDEITNATRGTINKIYMNTDKLTQEYKDTFGAEERLDEKNGIKFNMSIETYSIDKESFIKYVGNLGLNYEDVKGKGILLNTPYGYFKDKEKSKDIYKTVKVFDIKEGEKLSGRYFYAEDNMQEVEKVSDVIDIEIAKIANETPLGIATIYSRPYLILCIDDMPEDFTKYTFMQVCTNTIDSKITSDHLKMLLEEYKEEYREVLVDNMEDSVNAIRALYLMMEILLYGFIIVIALIGITNIFNTVTTNMNLRSKEFASLKSIGMTKKEFKRMIRLESFFYCSKSLIFAIPIGILISYLLYKVMLQGEIMFEYSLPVGAILISIVVVFILINVIMRYSISKINKQNTIETIRNENI